MSQILRVISIVVWMLGVSQGFAAEPTFDERLEKLAEEIERNRIEHHVPGCAIAVVRGDEVVFARGFGLAEIESDTPATPETRFFIGSSTKAFTATLIGMLVDDGKMSWDDPVTRHLPYFTLAIESDDEDAQATLRDIMSHRTGIPRMSMLWASGALSPDEILHQAAHAEPFAPFRKRFYYNNVMFLAAGWAGAAAGGEPWDELISRRILTPLGMSDTQTSIREARGGPRVARGYAWNEDLEEFKLHSPGPDSKGVDPVAPAGSISSTVLDMAKWLRFLLAEGVADGKRLISEEALTETWTEQIEIGGGVGYGMGWMLRDWQGQRLIEHGGAVPGGFSAEVAILPDSDLGFVLLANAYPTLFTTVAISLVPATLLGEWADDNAQDDESENFGPFLGKYIANFATFRDEVFTVLERNGRLALDVPSQRVYDLNSPDEDGKRQFSLTDQIAISFMRDDAGEVAALKMYQSGMEFIVPREGVEDEPEIDLDELHKYLGSYRAEGREMDLTVRILNQRLAFEVPSGGSLFDLDPPDDEARWVSRANADLFIAFDEAENGAVVGLELHRPGGASAISFRAAQGNETPLPTVEEIMALRQSTQSRAESVAIESTRRSGVIRFPHAAVEGRFEITTGGDDRLRIDMKLGRFGEIRVALDGDRAWRDTTFDMEPFQELRGKMLEQVRQGHPSALYGDWRKFFDSVSVLRAGELDGRKIYVVKLKKGDVPAIKLSVDAETGDVLKVEQTLILPGLGGMAVTTINEDFREVHGMRIAYRSIESNEQTGRTVYEVEDFEINLDLDEDTFIIRPPEER